MGYVRYDVLSELNLCSSCQCVYLLCANEGIDLALNFKKIPIFLTHK